MYMAEKPHETLEIIPQVDRGRGRVLHSRLGTVVSIIPTFADPTPSRDLEEWLVDMVEKPHESLGRTFYVDQFDQ